LDEAVLRRLIALCGATVGTIYGRNGKTHLQQRIAGYNRAAQHSPWVVLVDLDEDAACAPLLRTDWLPQPASQLCFQVAVRQVEAWLLADRQRLSRFLSVEVARLPCTPEAVLNPKQLVVELAGRSRSRAIREDMLPRPGSGHRVGPAYASRLIEFVDDTDRGWRPDVAANVSDSLARCLRCLRRLVHQEM
jgi:hypothetical protein